MLPKGTVLMSSRAPIGYVAIAANPISTNQGFKNFICHDDIDPEYVYYWIKFLNPYLEGMGSGSTFAEISGTRAKKIPIKYPPLAEQQHIVARVEALLSHVNATYDRLCRVPLIIKRFRQDVLSAACSGRLTDEWRDSNSTKESGFDLLQKINEASKQMKSKNFKKHNTVNQFESDSLQEIPEDWTWTTLEEITKNYDGQRIPIKSDDRKKRKGIYPYYGASGIIDTIDDFLFDGEFLLIGEDGANLIMRSTPIAFQAKGKFWVNNHAHILLCKGGIPLQYLEHYLNSIDLQPYVTGSAQPKLTQANMNTILIPLPPLSEQLEIVRRVEVLIRYSEQIEMSLKLAMKKTNTLSQAILVKAFKGELLKGI
jgi:type I restriction enzyme S subunit